MKAFLLNLAALIVSVATLFAGSAWAIGQTVVVDSLLLDVG